MKKQTTKQNDNEIKQAGQKYALKGLAALLCGIFLLVSYAGFPTGSLGKLADEILRYGLGMGAFFVPAMLVVLGYGFFRFHRNLLWTRGFAVFLLFYFCLSGFLHHFFVPAGEELTPSLLPEGGGLLGGLISRALHQALGTVGAMLLLLGGMLGSLILTGKFSFGQHTGEPEAEEAAAEVLSCSGKTADEPILSAGYAGEQGRSAEPLPGNRDVLSVYNDEEFAGFNDDVRKPSPFKKILDFGHKIAGSGEQGLSYDQTSDTASYEPASIEKVANRQATQGEKKELTRIYPEEQETVILQPSGFSADSRPLYGGTGEPEEGEECVAPWEADRLIPGNEEPGTSNRSRASVADPVAPASDTATAKASRFKLTPHGMQMVEAESEQTEKDTPGKPVENAYKLPPLSLLKNVKKTDKRQFDADVREQCKVLEKTLADFRVNARVIGVTRGPAVTRFELEPAPGVKVSSVVNLADDIALRLAAPGVRVEAPIPGKAAIGIEAPNLRNEMVGFKEVVDCAVVKEDASKLCVGLGKDISGNVITIDLSKMPHLLVAGSTGSGKSVCVNTLLAGILYKARPDEVKLILVDPKVVELTNYNGIPHLLVPVVTDAKKAASALHWAVAEMERRYQSFADTRVRDIKSYNAQAVEKMPFIVIVIDEMSDLMMVAKADVEDAILRLAQKARACGIHLVLATQRPSVDVITGIVKANIPSRIAFAVSSQTDSRTILDMGGAEKLLGKGDMLFYPIGSNKPLRVQGAFVSDEELNKVTDFIKEQAIPVEYSEEVTNVALPSDSRKNELTDGDTEAVDTGQDELLTDAIRLVLELGQASASMLQRRFRIGYNRAARLVDTMEEMGIVGPATGSKPRELKMSRAEVERLFLHTPSDREETQN